VGDDADVRRNGRPLTVVGSSGSTGEIGRLSPGQWVDFVAAGSTRDYAPGNYLFHEGDPPGAVFGVLSGQVRLIASAEGGRELLLAVKTSGEMFGELSVIDGLPRSASALAVDHVAVVAVPERSFIAFIEDHPGLAVQLLGVLAHRLRATTRLHVDQRGADLTRRVAAGLTQLAAEMGVVNGPDDRQVTLRITQTDLADWIGVNREATSRTLGRLRALGLVTTGRQRIELLDPPGLRRMGEG
jgi:CRP/FNR family cyclic AMP-dependent transcriptional regulator